jgi:hypothetical protein
MPYIMFNTKVPQTQGVANTTAVYMMNSFGSNGLALGRQW